LPSCKARGGQGSTSFESDLGAVARGADGCGRLALLSNHCPRHACIMMAASGRTIGFTCESFPRLGSLPLGLSACSDSASRNISRPQPMHACKSFSFTAADTAQASFLRAAQTEPCLASSKYEHLKYSNFLHTFACLEFRRCMGIAFAFGHPKCHRGCARKGTEVSDLWVPLEPWHPDIPSLIVSL
jgi:hypothetical protein